MATAAAAAAAAAAFLLMQHCFDFPCYSSTFQSEIEFPSPALIKAFVMQLRHELCI